MSLVDLVQLMMLNIKCMSMMFTLTNGDSYLFQVNILVFPTSSVASWLLLVDACLLTKGLLIKSPHLMKLIKFGHLTILISDQLGASQGWLLIWSMLLLPGEEIPLMIK